MPALPWLKPDSACMTRGAEFVLQEPGAAVGEGRTEPVDVLHDVVFIHGDGAAVHGAVEFEVPAAVPGNEAAVVLVGDPHVRAVDAGGVQAYVRVYGGTVVVVGAGLWVQAASSRAAFRVRVMFLFRIRRDKGRGRLPGEGAWRVSPRALLAAVFR